MKQRKNKMRIVVSTIAAAVATAFAAPASAVDFEFGDGWKGSWDNNVSLGTAWRMNNPDQKLYSASGAALSGLPGGQAPNTVDEGNQNYHKGDRFTTLAKWFTELQVQKGDMGALIRAKAWYDYTLNKEDVHYGNQPNGYRKAPLSDDGFEALNKFDGVYLLDAYVYNTFDVGGKPLQLRVGNQVVNWGESLFVQGLNQINPIDVPSFHKPGAQLKEVFLPVPIVFASQSLGSLGSLEAFYQVKWQATPLDVGCGNYWALALSNMATSIGKCNNAISIAGGSQPMGTTLGTYISAIDTNKPSDSGQFGLAYRFNIDALDTEFGLYGMKYHSRLPIVSIVNLANAKTQPKGALGFAAPFDVIWEYPEDIKAFGISATTNVLGWSLAGELSQRRDVPVQVDGNDLLNSGVAASGMVIPGTPIAWGPYGPDALASSGLTGGSGYLPGYTRANITQFQVNTVKAGNRLLGGDFYVFVAEAGFQWNNLPDYKKDPNAVRYGRAFLTGGGSNQNYALPLGLPAGTSSCALGLATTPEGCDNDGYVSRFAWGYRLKMDVTYNDVFYGVAMTPSIFFSHDVKGVSADSQFNEDRMALGLAVKFNYNKKYSLDIGATMFNHAASYDTLRDRDFFHATASMSF